MSCSKIDWTKVLIYFICFVLFPLTIVLGLKLYLDHRKEEKNSLQEPKENKTEIAKKEVTFWTQLSTTAITITKTFIGLFT